MVHLTACTGHVQSKSLVHFRGPEQLDIDMSSISDVKWSRKESRGYERCWKITYSKDRLKIACPYLVRIWLRDQILTRGLAGSPLQDHCPERLPKERTVEKKVLSCTQEDLHHTEQSKIIPNLVWKKLSASWNYVGTTGSETWISWKRYLNLTADWGCEYKGICSIWHFAQFVYRIKNSLIMYTGKSWDDVKILQ